MHLRPWLLRSLLWYPSYTWHMMLRPYLKQACWIHQVVMIHQVLWILGTWRTCWWTDTVTHQWCFLLDRGQLESQSRNKSHNQNKSPSLFGMYDSFQNMGGYRQNSDMIFLDIICHLIHFKIIFATSLLQTMRNFAPGDIGVDHTSSGAKNAEAAKNVHEWSQINGANRAGSLTLVSRWVRVFICLLFWILGVGDAAKKPRKPQTYWFNTTNSFKHPTHTSHKCQRSHESHTDHLQYKSLNSNKWSKHYQKGYTEILQRRRWKKTIAKAF